MIYEFMNLKISKIFSTVESLAENFARYNSYKEFNVLQLRLLMGCGQKLVQSYH